LTAPEPRLTSFDTAMVVVSLVIGIGIFRTPALVAGAAGSPARFLAAWAIGGVVSLVGALVFAEIGSRYPRAGGFYKVVAHCWNPMLAFLLNWAQVLMQGAGAAGVATIGAEYLLRLTGSTAPQGRTTLLVAAVLIAGMTGLNAAGIRSGARAQVILSLAKIVLILGLAVAGLAAAGPRPAPAEGSAPASSPDAVPAGMLTALVAVFYTYGGYQNTMNLAGDVRDPRRGLPWGICVGMVIVMAIYLVINTAYLHALGAPAIAGSPLVAADLARAALGRWGEQLVSLAIFLSAAGFVNATILHVPRGYLAMSQDRLLPQALGRLSAGTQAQLTGLLFFAVTALVPLCLLGAFDKLLAYVMFTDALSLAALASCIFILRRRGEGDTLGDAWRMPGYPWLPALFVLALLGIAADVLLRQTLLALGGVAIVVAGVPLYFVMRRSLAES